jgi:hypothetical protein
MQPHPFTMRKHRHAIPASPSRDRLVERGLVPSIVPLDEQPGYSQMIVHATLRGLISEAAA